MPQFNLKLLRVLKGRPHTLEEAKAVCRERGWALVRHTHFQAVSDPVQVAGTCPSEILVPSPDERTQAEIEASLARMHNVAPTG